MRRFYLVICLLLFADHPLHSNAEDRTKVGPAKMARQSGGDSASRRARDLAAGNVKMSLIPTTWDVQVIPIPTSWNVRIDVVKVEMEKRQAK